MEHDETSMILQTHKVMIMLTCEFHLTIKKQIINR